MADIDDSISSTENTDPTPVATAVSEPLTNGDMDHDADSTTSGDQPVADQISAEIDGNPNSLSPTIADSPKAADSPKTDVNNTDETTLNEGDEEVDAHIPTLDTVVEEDNDDTANDIDENSANSGPSSDGADNEDTQSNGDGVDNDDLSKVDDDRINKPTDTMDNDEDVSQASSDVSTSRNPIESVDIDDDAMDDNDNSNSTEDNEVLFVPPAEQEVLDISDSDDEPPQEVEHMDVDGGAGRNVNGIAETKKNPVNNSNDTVDKKFLHKSNGLIKPSPVHADDDDDDDCVVIEDDDPVDVTPPIKNGRSRKSVLKPRDFEEDIEVITGDPLSPPAKKPKTASMGITIQDARSLAVDPLANANSIMNRSNAETVQALQNQNISILPVSVMRNTQPVYPTSMRASITPVTPKHTQQTTANHASPQTNNKPAPVVASPAAPVLPLLPALTDDMFVLEAPSFIVPYIYEKPPADNLREIVETIRKELAEQKKQEDVDVAEQEAKELEALSKEQRKLAELAKVADANKKKSAKKKKRPTDNDDDSWGESDTSSDDEMSDAEQKTKVLIKEADNDINAISTQIHANGMIAPGTTPNPDNYFESPLGKFFMDIAVNLVQEHVQTDLLRQQKKRLRREGESAAPSVQMAIKSLTKNLEHSKSKNKMFKFQTKRCEFCNFKSESSLAMANHYEAPHLNGQMYKCNFCPFEARPPYDILFHMEAMHNVKARIEKAQTYHQCPNCPFEDNGKSKLARHALVCAKKFRPEINLNPPLDWEPPAKIPRLKPRHGLVGTATAYQAMAAQAQRTTTANVVQQQRPIAIPGRGRGRPATVNYNIPTNMVRNNNIPTPVNLASVRQSLPGLNLQNTAFTMNAAGQIVQAPGPKSSKVPPPSSISITALPRQPNTNNTSAMANMQAYAASPNGMHIKPGQPAPTSGKSALVICEICDGHIKDLDQLRLHMQWIHEVKIHPKMIYNRPPLNCQKCQFRFFTDQGLERHLLGSHGLVTSSMQEAANKGKDSGRCPICGRFLQSKLLNHVSRDHTMTLKPAHLSYKCTVCTATFGMYKQFENHVYSAHSNVAKKAMDSKGKSASATASPAGSGASRPTNSKASANDSVLKTFKINDEITIIPQPTQSQHQRQSRGAKGAGSNSSSGGGGASNMDSQVIEIL